MVYNFSYFVGIHSHARSFHILDWSLAYRLHRYLPQSISFIINPVYNATIIYGFNMVLCPIFIE